MARRTDRATATAIETETEAGAASYWVVPGWLCLEGAVLGLLVGCSWGAPATCRGLRLLPGLQEPEKRVGRSARPRSRPQEGWEAVERPETHQNSTINETDPESIIIDIFLIFFRELLD